MLRARDMLAVTPRSMHSHYVWDGLSPAHVPSDVDGVPVGGRPWLQIRLPGCGAASCIAEAAAPLAVPTRERLARIAILSTVLYDSTPLLPKMLEYYRHHFGVVDFIAYHMDSWEYGSKAGEARLQRELAAEATGRYKLEPSAAERGGVQRGSGNVNGGEQQDSRGVAPTSVPAVRLHRVPWYNRLGTYWFSKDLAMVEALERLRLGAFDYVLVVDPDELLVWHNINGTGLLRRLAELNAAAPEEVTCFSFERRDTMRDCVWARGLTSDTVRGEDMVRVVQMAYAKNQKFLFRPGRTLEISTHNCFPGPGHVGLRLSREDDGFMAHVARGEPNATTCDDGGQHMLESDREQLRARIKDWQERAEVLGEGVAAEALAAPN